MNTDPRSDPFRCRLPCVLLVLLASVSCSAYKPKPLVGVAAVCDPILDRGVFTTETLADPATSEAVNRLLCGSLVTAVRSPRLLGFGEGSPMMGGSVETNEWGAHVVAFADRADSFHWFTEHCSGDPYSAWRQQAKASRALSLGTENMGEISARVAEYRRQELASWKPALDTLPPGDVSAWKQCAHASGLTHTGVGRLGCSGFAQPTENGRVVFQVSNLQTQLFCYMPFVHLFMGPRLKKDLYIEGATCEGDPWLKSKQFRDFSFGPYVLECKRKGTAAVRIELQTRGDACTFASAALDTAG